MNHRMVTMKRTLVIFFVLFNVAFQLGYGAPKPDEREMSEKMAKYRRRKESLMKDDDVNARMFPSVILNQVWKEARATYQSDPQTLKHIQTQLQELQKDELELQNKAKSGDPGVKDESKLYKDKIKQLMDKYSLTPQRNKGEPQIKDSKLKDLWTKISNTNTSAEELYEIRRELEHFQSKIDQLEVLIQKDPLMKALNSIPPQELVSSKNLLADFPQLKEFEEQGNNLTMARGYFLSLRSTISMGVSRMNLLADETTTFKQPVVEKLWAEVVAGDFTMEERESLKYDLMDLEKTLKEQQKAARETDKISAHLKQGGSSYTETDRDRSIQRQKELGKNIKQKISKLPVSLEKYEAERRRAMKQDDVTSRVFASVLLNQVWKEAVAMYKDDPKTLSVIKSGLQELQGEELELKKLSKSGDKSVKTKVEPYKEKMRQFFEKYSLLKTPKMNSGEPLLKDERLKELWLKISNTETNAQELFEIRKELEHYQEKLGRLETLIEKDPLMKKLASLPAQDLVLSKNLVRDFPELKSFEDQGFNLNQSRAYFLYLRQEVATGFLRMDLIANTTGDATFKQPIVERLWEEIQAGEFSLEEQENFKMDLVELEQKLTEQQKLQRKMDRVDKDFSKGGNRYSQEELEKLKEEHSMLSADVKNRLKKLPVSLEKFREAKSRVMKDDNRKGRDFSSVFLNQIWKDAMFKYQSDKKKLSQIRKDLEAIQQEEAIAKKAAKAGGGRPRGGSGQKTPEVEAVMGKLKQFFQKYSLISPPKNSGGQVLKDKRLKELWNSISNTETNADELVEIRKELEHYQGKLNHLESLIEGDPLMKVLDSIPPQDLVLSKNLVEDFPELKAFEEQGANLTQARGYYVSLRHVLATGFMRMDLLASGNATFKQPIVEKLWAEVQAGNFSVDEQESLKFDLMDLEIKLTEQQRAAREVDSIKQRMSKDSSGVDPAHHEQAVSRQKSLTDQIMRKLKSLPVSLGKSRAASEL